MQTLIIDFTETKFFQYIFGIDFSKNELDFAKLALSIIASQICFLEAFFLGCHLLALLETCGGW